MNIVKARTCTVLFISLVCLPISSGAQENAPFVLGAEVVQEDIEDALSNVIEGVSWHVSSEEFLDSYYRHLMSTYRTNIAGMRDPLMIDDIRREYEDQYERVLNSHEQFDGTRTGYEVSVLGREIAAGNDEGMYTLRTDYANVYFVFSADRLFKTVIAYNESLLGEMPFGEFVEILEAKYGPADSTDIEYDEMSLPYLARAEWQRTETRLRVENQSNLFGAFILVFSSTDLEDRVSRLRGPSGASEQTGVSVSDLIQSLGQGGNIEQENSNIADEIIFQEPEDEAVPEVEEGAPDRVE